MAMRGIGAWWIQMNQIPSLAKHIFCRIGFQPVQNLLRCDQAGHSFLAEMSRWTVPDRREAWRDARPTQDRLPASRARSSASFLPHDKRIDWKGVRLVLNQTMKNGLTLSLVILVSGAALPACKQSAGPAPANVAPSAKEPAAPQVKSTSPDDSKAAALTAPNSSSQVSSRQVLVFRNVRSWNRRPDFEEILTDLAFKFDVRSSLEMGSQDLAPYLFVIIPGAQWQDDYYRDYADNAARFDAYVTNGGTLVLELNGAERDGITLPGGVSMVNHGARDNAILLADHPILAPMGGKPIHANYASHGYLKNVPSGALTLATEMAGDESLTDKPTFVEYSYGKGRVIAACQCFHDRDGSGRGRLMETLLTYAAEREWFSKPK